MRMATNENGVRIWQTKEVNEGGQDEPQAAVGGARDRPRARDRTAGAVAAEQGGGRPADDERLPADHAARPGQDDRLLLQPGVRATRHGHADDERPEPRQVPGVPQGLRERTDGRRQARAAARAGNEDDAGADPGADGQAAAVDGGAAAEPAGDAA